MKIGICGDVHWSQYSSIVRSRGAEFSTRLENCIDSVNWAEQLFETTGCERIVYVGDFFDKPELNSEEITALTKVQWSPIHHTMLVGNHEMGRNDLSISSMHVFQSMKNFTVVSEPSISGELFLLPYILESDRKPLQDYCLDKRRIIISHNDIKGVQMGAWLSDIGFGKDEIHSCCDLFINGHLHNGSKVEDGIINIGNLTGQTFSEDAFKYDHVVFVLDTDTLKIDVYENPYAMNFYKLDSTNGTIPWELKPNAVITVKVNEEDLALMKESYRESFDIIADRYIIQPKIKDLDKEEVKQNFSMDHLAEFSKFILSTEENNTEIMREELSEVLK